MSSQKRSASKAAENDTEIGRRAALLGHDIRNAVADILGGLALADLDPLDPASRQQLQRVRSAGEQLARLSDEVLALVTGDQGTTIADSGQTLRLIPFLEDIEARWAAHAREKNLRFALELGNDLPAAIGTDRGALERILANLIGNAMKHTVEGEVTLSVGMRPQEALSLTVRDTGPGFSDDALARLFEAGGRPPESATPGTGLGLHIVHDLGGQINGHMQVGNRSLGGAEVAVLLPRAAWAPGVSAHAQDSALPDLSGKCVLVAEDNPTNQLLIRQMLETLGADTRLAADGREALALLDNGHFYLALIDIEMPRLSGLDLIRSLRRSEAHEKAPPLPVLAITAYVLSANRDEIYEAGADGILAKPIISLESFGEAIAAVLRDGPAYRPAENPTQDDSAATPLNTLRLDRLLALAGVEGPELLNRLREDFDTVQRGIRDGLSAPDFALLRARTHVLISLAGAVGSDELQGMAETMSAAAQSQDHAAARALGPRVVKRIDTVLTHLDAELNSRYIQGVG